MSLEDDIKRHEARIAAANAPKLVNGQRKKNPSGHGKGKWETKSALAAYRRKRDAKRKGR